MSPCTPCWSCNVQYYSSSIPFLLLGFACHVGQKFSCVPKMREKRWCSRGVFASHLTKECKSGSRSVSCNTGLAVRIFAVRAASWANVIRLHQTRAVMSIIHPQAITICYGHDNLGEIQIRSTTSGNHVSEQNHATIIAASHISPSLHLRRWPIIDGKACGTHVDILSSGFNALV